MRPSRWRQLNDSFLEIHRPTFNPTFFLTSSHGCAQMQWVLAPRREEGCMGAKGSVEIWLEDLQAGHVSALGKLHQRYWPGLVGYARRKLRRESQGPADEEDLVQAAFLSFHRALREGRVEELSSRENFLALLTTIIARKAARKAPGPEQMGVDDPSVLEALAANTEVSPAEQAMLRDCYRRYVGGLPHRLRPVAEMCLAGLTHREIAAAIPCAVRTVERKMSRVLDLWHERAAASGD